MNTTKQDPRPTDTADVLAAVERSLDAPAPRGRRDVITHDPMPVVMADPLQLEQVFTNLVSNAIKFRRPGRTAAGSTSARAGGRLLGVLGRRQRDRDRARVLRPDLRDLPAPPHKGRRTRARGSALRSSSGSSTGTAANPGRVDAGRGLDLLLHPAGRVKPGQHPAGPARGPRRRSAECVSIRRLHQILQSSEVLVDVARIRKTGPSEGSRRPRPPRIARSPRARAGDIGRRRPAVGSAHSKGRPAASADRRQIGAPGPIRRGRPAPGSRGHREGAASRVGAQTEPGDAAEPNEGRSGSGFDGRAGHRHAYAQSFYSSETR